MNKLFEPKKPVSFGSCGKLHYAFHSLFERDWNGLRHSHNCSEIFFCLNGRGSFSVRDRVEKAGPFDFVFVNPHVEHSESSCAESPLEYVCLGISGMELPLANPSGGYFLANYKDFSARILGILSALLHELQAQEQSFEEICSHLMEILILYLDRLTSFHPVPTLASSGRTDPMLDWLREYLDENFTRDLNLDQLAVKVGMNKYSLIKNFQQRYGTTPIRYLLDRRFNQAKFLLETTQSTIRQISDALGFSSPSYFSQCFQRREGISPTEYRLRTGHSHDRS